MRAWQEDARKEVDFGSPQSGLLIAPLLSHVVEQGIAAAQGSGETISGNAAARLSEDLQKVDAFGVDGANPVDEQEVLS